MWRSRVNNKSIRKKHVLVGQGLLEEEGAPLSGVEKGQLAQWRAVQERLLAQVARVDDVVAVMRDFDGKDVSMV